jgi:hypothetical protein
MKSAQLKDQSFLDRTDPHKPIFLWQKTALIGDEFYTWWLYYGNATGKDTLCHRLFHPLNKPLDQRARVAIAWNLRSIKAKLRNEWRNRYEPSPDA